MEEVQLERVYTHVQEWYSMGMFIRINSTARLEQQEVG